jgi:hypothetical protein
VTNYFTGSYMEKWLSNAVLVHINVTVKAVVVTLPTTSPINVWLTKTFFTRSATWISLLQRYGICTPIKHPCLLLDNLRSICILCPVDSTQHGVSSSSTRMHSSWVLQFRVPLKSLIIH